MSERGKTHLRFSSEEVSELEPSLIRTSGAVSFDEWGIDGVRLCVASLKDAEERGARVFHHSAVTGVERASDGQVSGVVSLTFDQQACAATLGYGVHGALRGQGLAAV